jgi:hypothetical protein
VKRRLFAIASALSFILFLAVCLLWIRSHAAIDIVCVGRQDAGGIRIEHFDWDRYPYGSGWPPPKPAWARLTVLSFSGKLRVAESSQLAEPTRRARISSWSSDDNIVPSFSYWHSVSPDIRGGGAWLVRHVTARHWAVAVIFAALPAVHLATLLTRRILTRKRRGHDLCPSCGYDLHATPGRCPECGQLPQQNNPH